MSVKIMGMIWDLNIPSGDKLLLLAYADHADHDGGSIYPSIATIARKCGYSTRTVQRITQKLQEQGYLIPVGEHKGGRYITNRWRIPVQNGSIQPMPQKGDIMSPLEKGVIYDIKGDIFDRKGDIDDRKGDIDDRKGDTVVSPEPLLTIKQPSNTFVPATQAHAPVTEKRSPSKKTGQPSKEKEPTISKERIVPMVAALGQVTAIDVRLKYGFFAKIAKQLILADYTPEQVLQYYSGKDCAWFKFDWRGQKGQLPTVGQIQETIGGYAKGVFQQANNSHNGRSARSTNTTLRDWAAEGAYDEDQYVSYLHYNRAGKNRAGAIAELIKQGTPIPVEYLHPDEIEQLKAQGAL